MRAGSIGPRAGLTETEVSLVRGYHVRLLVALRSRDRQAVRSAQQAVLQGAYRGSVPPALRRALRELVWLMAGYVAGRQLRWHGRQRI